MTQQEKLLKVFKELDLNPTVEKDGTGTWVTLEAEGSGKPGFGGYSGFYCRFAFDPNGKFIKEDSGVWE